MQDVIHIREELVLEARPDGPYILLRREGAPGSIRICLNEVQYLAGAMWTMAAEAAGIIAGDEGNDVSSTLAERGAVQYRSLIPRDLSGRYCTASSATFSPRDARESC